MKDSGVDWKLDQISRSIRGRLAKRVESPHRELHRRSAGLDALEAIASSGAQPWKWLAAANWGNVLSGPNTSSVSAATYGPCVMDLRVVALFPLRKTRFG